MTTYQRPGLRPLAAPGTAGKGQACWQASNGDGYIIVDNRVYYIDPNWAVHQIGSITANWQKNICSITDNGIEALIVFGAPFAGNAAGSISFAVNPVNGSTITLNGVVWTFKAAPVNPTDVQIGGTTAFTIATLLTQTQASVDPLMTVAYYDATLSGGTAVFYIAYRTQGAIGTSYTLAASVATPSGAVLALGNTLPGYAYTFPLGSISGSAVTQLVDPAWYGADRVDFIDTFIIFNIPGTRNFGSTLSNDIIPLDPTYIAGKTAWPDPVKGVIVNQGDILLLGSLKSEVWYNTGGASFPFARQPSTQTEHGLAATMSLASADINVYWLSADLQGRGIVLRIRGNEVTRISNHALEYAIRQMMDAGLSISDAVGFTWQQDGHIFYTLNFPAGNQTWVWDESIGQAEYGWSQRAWTNTNGGLDRDRGVLGANFYGTNVVLDWENGTLYAQDPTEYVDEVLGREYPITYVRSFAHLVTGTDPRSGGPVLANGQMVQHDRFAIDAECGNAPTGSEPRFLVRWSDDRGKSWGQWVELVAGEQGQFTTRPDLRSLGQAMDRVYELSWTFSGQVALNGAWVEGKVLNQ